MTGHLKQLPTGVADERGKLDKVLFKNTGEPEFMTWTVSWLDDTTHWHCAGSQGCVPTHELKSGTTTPERQSCCPVGRIRHLMSAEDVSHLRQAL